MNFNNQKVLIIYPYPYINTNPTMSILMKILADQGKIVDVYTAKSKEFRLPKSFSHNIKYYYYPETLLRLLIFSPKGRKLGRLQRFLPNGLYFSTTKALLLFYGAIKSRNYNWLIGVDPYGLIIANYFNNWSKGRLGYISFEIMFPDEINNNFEARLSNMERTISKNVSLVLIQDEERAELFCRDRVGLREKIVLAPVAPAPVPIQRTDYLQKLLNIMPNKKIVLYIGSLQNWSMYDQWLDLVSGWPDEFCLVIHSRSEIDQETQIYFEKLANSGKIYISTKPVTNEELLILVASADYGLASYKPTYDHWVSGKNLYHLGLASGKVAYYTMCGLPILATPIPVFEKEIKKYQFGKLFYTLSETGHLLQEMNNNYEYYSAEARRFYDDMLNPLPGLQNFCNRMLD